MAWSWRVWLEARPWLIWRTPRPRWCCVCWRWDHLTWALWTACPLLRPHRPPLETSKCPRPTMITHPCGCPGFNCPGKVQQSSAVAPPLCLPFTPQQNSCFRLNTRLEKRLFLRDRCYNNVSNNRDYSIFLPWRFTSFTVTVKNLKHAVQYFHFRWIRCPVHNGWITHSLNQHLPDYFSLLRCISLILKAGV